MSLHDRLNDYAWFVRSSLVRHRYHQSPESQATIVVVPGIYEGTAQLEPVVRTLSNAGYAIVRVKNSRCSRKPRMFWRESSPTRQKKSMVPSSSSHTRKAGS